MKSTPITITKDLNYYEDHESVPPEQGIYFIFECMPCPQGSVCEFDLRYIGWSDNMKNDIAKQRIVNPDFHAYKNPRHIVCYSALPDTSREELEQCADALIYHCQPRDNPKGKDVYLHPPIHIYLNCPFLTSPCFGNLHFETGDIYIPSSKLA